MEIQGNAFIVAGGGRGLGAATARRLAGQGAMVVIGDINEEAGSAVADSLGDRSRFPRRTSPSDSVEQLVALAEHRAVARDQLRRHRHCDESAGPEGHDLGAFSALSREPI